MVNDLRPSKNKQVRQGPSFFFHGERTKEECNGTLKRSPPYMYIISFEQSCHFFLTFVPVSFSLFSCLVLPPFFTVIFFFFSRVLPHLFYTLNLTIDFPSHSRGALHGATQRGVVTVVGTLLGSTLPLRVSSLSPDIVVAASSSGAALCASSCFFFFCSYFSLWCLDWWCWQRQE